MTKIRHFQNKQLEHEYAKVPKQTQHEYKEIQGFKNKRIAKVEQ